MASRFVPDPEASTAMLMFFSMGDKRHLPDNVPDTKTVSGAQPSTGT